MPSLSGMDNLHTLRITQDLVNWEKGTPGKKGSTKGHGLKTGYITSFSCCVTKGILGIILFDKAGKLAALSLHQSFPVNSVSSPTLGGKSGTSHGRSTNSAHQLVKGGR